MTVKSTQGTTRTDQPMAPTEETVEEEGTIDPEEASSEDQDRSKTDQ